MIKGKKITKLPNGQVLFHCNKNGFALIFHFYLGNSIFDIRTNLGFDQWSFLDIPEAERNQAVIDRIVEKNYAV